MTDSMTPNGLATSLKDYGYPSTYLITITAGVFFHTIYNAYCILSDENFIPDLPSAGEYSEETINNPFFSLKCIKIPESLERRNFAVPCAISALQNAFFHELAHVLRGHTDIKTFEGSENNIQRRAIEMDADIFSGIFMAKALPKKLKLQEFSAPESQLKDKLHKTLVGVFIMYSWFGAGANYHSGPIRAYTVIKSMLNHLEIRDQETWIKDEIASVILAMIKNTGLPSTTGTISTQEIDDLRETEEYRKKNQVEWLKNLVQ